MLHVQGIGANGTTYSVLILFLENGEPLLERYQNEIWERSTFISYFFLLKEVTFCQSFKKEWPDISLIGFCYDVRNFEQIGNIV